ncbi:hypothetical protein EDD21DRAFT_437840 [Dissophora ornata]|nr:hypothetical protein EDD21DRAFT_437840 [Dissophora ornata]
MAMVVFAITESAVKEALGEGRVVNPEAIKHNIRHSDKHQASIDVELNALYHISSILTDMESDLSKFPTLPQITMDSIINIPADHTDNQERSSYEPTQKEYADLAKKHAAQLRQEQLSVFNAILDNRTNKRLFFIDGPGSTGKTFLYNTLIERIRGRMHKAVIAVACSGIALIILHQ